ncbi:MAG: MATE family efflux transporter [Pseudomonadota bacterium]
MASPTDIPAAPSSWGQRTWHTIRRSLRNETADATQGPVADTLTLLAIPMAAEMLLEGVFALVDIVLVARLGKEAVSAVGLTEAMLTLIYAVAIGLASAATAMVARRVGEGAPKAAADVGGQVLLLCGVLGLVIALVGFNFADELLALIGADETVIETGRHYTTIQLGGAVSVLALFVINGVFRGAGNAAIAMRALWLSNAINIVLDPLLIFGLGPFPAMGVTGAAVATVIGRSTGVLYQCWHLFGGTQAVHLSLGSLLPRPRLMGRLIYVASGAIAQFLFATSAWIFLMRIVATFGSGAVAGYTIAIRIVDFVIMPMWGLGNATATMVGQNLGAKQPQRAEDAVWLASRFTFVVMAAAGLLIALIAPWLIALLIDDGEALRYGIAALRFLGIGLGAFSLGLMLIQAFNGAGDTYTPMRINFVVFWVMQLPMAWLLAISAGLGPNGVFAAVIGCETVLSIAAFVLFRRGKWKLREV